MSRKGRLVSIHSHNYRLHSYSFHDFCPYAHFLHLLPLNKLSAVGIHSFPQVLHLQRILAFVVVYWPNISTSGLLSITLFINSSWVIDVCFVALDLEHFGQWLFPWIKLLAVGNQTSPHCLQWHSILEDVLRYGPITSIFGSFSCTFSITEDCVHFCLVFFVVFRSATLISFSAFRTTTSF